MLRSTGFLMSTFAMNFCMYSGIALGSEIKVAIADSNQELLRHYTQLVSFGLRFEDGVIVNGTFSHDELFRGDLSKWVPHESRVESCFYTWLVSTQVLSDEKELGVLHQPDKFESIEGRCETSLEGFLIRPGNWNFYQVNLTIGNRVFQSSDTSYLFLNLATITPEGDSFVPSLANAYEGILTNENTPYSTSIKFFADKPFLLKCGSHLAIFCRKFK
jgi:hypothetical protein